MEKMVKCERCGKEFPKSETRKWKGKRYCKSCYKKVSKKERELMGIATGF